MIMIIIAQKGFFEVGPGLRREDVLRQNPPQRAALDGVGNRAAIGRGRNDRYRALPVYS